MCVHKASERLLNTRTIWAFLTFELPVALKNVHICAHLLITLVELGLSLILMARSLMIYWFITIADTIGSI